MPLADTEQINIELVVAVEEYPVLYDYNLKEYSNRNEQDRAWRLLATKFEATEAECKLRWRNIRSAFTRYLRSKNTTGSGAKKQYYLWEHLQYLLPFTKSKTQSGNLGRCVSSHQKTVEINNNTEESVDDPGESNQTAENITNDTAHNVQEDTVVVPSSSTPSSSLSSWRSSKVAKKTDPLEKAVTNYFEKKQKFLDPDTSADMNFLKSLLPDVASLPPPKKRLFKRKVLEFLDELSVDDSLPSPVSSATSTSAATPPTETSQLPIIFITDNAQPQDGEFLSGEWNI